ncbi:MAG: ZIP family metal transporter [Planctomycetota bacterium]|nr:ZIP family metal transporter [Planctomycetota bacterium]
MDFSPTLVLFCLVIAIVSVAGGLVPSFLRLTHRRMQLALSLVAGVMLGVGLMHMLGHAAEMALHAPAGSSPPNIHDIMLAAVGGFLAMFLLERFFCFHHHETPDEQGHTCGHDHGADEGVACSEDAPASTHRLHWVGALIGLTVHTLLSGLALGAAYGAGVSSLDQAAGDGEVHGATWLGIPGFAVFLGIVLHKPFDSFTIVALMRHSGRTGLAVHLVNLAFALVIPLGVGLYFAGADLAADSVTFTSLALAFSAGTFLCVAASDVLPELQFHRHDRVGMTAMLVLGLLIAWGSGIFEAAGHDHDHHGHGHGHAGHDHSGHDHSGHDHSGHDHSGHDHSGHDHGPPAGPMTGPPAPEGPGP